MGAGVGVGVGVGVEVGIGVGPELGAGLPPPPPIGSVPAYEARMPNVVAAVTGTFPAPSPMSEFNTGVIK